MTIKKITSIALVCGLITASTGCVYQAELTEFLDDPTGMKAEAEMTAEYETLLMPDWVYPSVSAAFVIFPISIVRSSIR